MFGQVRRCIECGDLFLCGIYPAQKCDGCQDIVWWDNEGIHTVEKQTMKTKRSHNDKTIA